jgi:hypothetical protein
MSFSQDELEELDEIFRPYCASRAPATLKDKLRVEYQIEGHAVVITESHPSLRDRRAWTPVVVAKFRFNRAAGKWTLYYADQNSRWHVYTRTRPVRYLDSLLRAVDEDVTGIFWG